MPRAPKEAQELRPCDKCKRLRKLHQYNNEELCGTCISRYERRVNTQEMYGKGRRGY